MADGNYITNRKKRGRPQESTVVYHITTYFVSYQAVTECPRRVLTIEVISANRGSRISLQKLQCCCSRRTSHGVIKKKIKICGRNVVALHNICACTQRVCILYDIPSKVIPRLKQSTTLCEIFATHLIIFIMLLLATI